MREGDRKASVLDDNHTKRCRDKKIERKPQPGNDLKTLNKKEVKSEASDVLVKSGVIASELNTGVDPSEVYEDMVIHYMDDAYRSEDAVTDVKAHKMVVKESRDKQEDCLSDQEREFKQGKEEESDTETLKDSISSQGETPTVKDDKVQRTSRVPKKVPKKQSPESFPRAARTGSDRQEVKKLQSKTSKNTQKKSQKPNKGAAEATAKGHDIKLDKVKVPSKPSSESSDDNKCNIMKVPSMASSESSEGGDDKATEELKEIDVLDEAPNGTLSIGTDDEMANTEGNVLGKDNVNQNIEEMEFRIEKLEEELREMAALEISLYSVVPEHGSSAHKVHTPARRLSRLYIHACKHWTQNKRASIARNTVSGLVLIAKSCGNDVPRLTFWWSNTVVLREIISQAFGNSNQSSLIGRVAESNGNGKRNEGKPLPQKWNGSAGYKQVKKLGFMQFVDDWQETSTFTAALEKIESWIFSRIIESVWWQTLTPHMQSPVEDLYKVKSSGRLMGPALGDQQQGSFSINLWKSAFMDAFRRLCPVRAGGHECGCLPVLARMVMEQCVARLDVAMFNAILRESANEIPTDPVSDPIVDSKVLPIPAGDLSFGSGAQLKNSIGNWSRWLTDMFGMDANDSKEEITGKEDRKHLDAESKSFTLLNVLSDLLMLPKDMLIDRSIRKEVCPSLGLSLIKRILCNFTPDEFCPDPVPGSLLEVLNSESLLECRQSDGELIDSFPVCAAPTVYCPPSLADVVDKVADIGGQAELGRNVSIVERKGYKSDEELDDLESPLTSVIDKMPPTSTTGNGRRKELACDSGESVRYELLRQSIVT
eukprot:TRINITY_DN4288_c0_g1_i1.p1 TRINITY_DN4288_c0_g1~~TRINITY_DN4288_c0_g1_i1.p1  ORF type:complete len:822 (+),score=204.43 TRINITY_DN4288_c0_g1_i1:453-2918(+)